MDCRLIPSRLSLVSLGDVDPRCDRGDIVLGWITRIVVVFAVAGVALFDAISVGTTYVNVSDQAANAAREASETWDSTKSPQKAYESAVAAATKSDDGNAVDPKSFRIDPDGRVHLRVRRTATTLVLYRVGPLRHWADVEGDGSGRAV